MLSTNIAHKILDDATRPRNEAKTLERKETSVIILTVRFKTVRQLDFRLILFKFGVGIYDCNTCVHAGVYLCMRVGVRSLLSLLPDGDRGQ